MRVVHQEDLHKRVVDKWLSYAADEDGPTVSDEVLLCGSCGAPVPRAVILAGQTICKVCLKRGLEMMEESP